MPTPVQVYEGLKAVCLKLKVADGYSIDLTPEKFNTVIIPPDEGATLDTDQYPRGYLVAHGADYEGLPSKRQLTTAPYTFMILLGFNPQDQEDTPEMKMLAVLTLQGDVERLVLANSQFAGTDQLVLSAFSSDVALNGPEVALVFDLTVTYRRQL